MQLFKGFDNVWQLFIRPIRYQYYPSDLGFPTFSTKNGVQVQRHDFEIKNQRNLILRCSYFQPILLIQQPILTDCIIYLHSMNGSRMQGIQYVDEILGNEISLLVFDFSGSGISEGEYISLGWFQTQDVECVIGHMRNTYKNLKNYSIFGRSMGAVTALLYAQRDRTIRSLVVDSPFSNMKLLAQEIAKLKVNLPSLILRGALSIVYSIIKEKAHFNLQDVDVMKNLKFSRIPCLFIASKRDSVVDFHHTQDIYKNYDGPQRLYSINLDHNETRDIQYIRTAIEFFKQSLENLQEEGVQFSIPQVHQADAGGFRNIMSSHFYKTDGAEHFQDETDFPIQKSERVVSQSENMSALRIDTEEVGTPQANFTRCFNSNENNLRSQSLQNGDLIKQQCSISTHNQNINERNSIANQGNKNSERQFFCVKSTCINIQKQQQQNQQTAAPSLSSSVNHRISNQATNFEIPANPLNNQNFHRVSAIGLGINKTREHSIQRVQVSKAEEIDKQLRNRFGTDINWETLVKYSDEHYNKLKMQEQKRSNISNINLNSVQTNNKNQNNSNNNSTNANNYSNSYKRCSLQSNMNQFKNIPRTNFQKLNTEQNYRFSVSPHLDFKPKGDDAQDFYCPPSLNDYGHLQKIKGDNLMQIASENRFEKIDHNKAEEPGRMKQTIKNQEFHSRTNRQDFVGNQKELRETQKIFDVPPNYDQCRELSVDREAQKAELANDNFKVMIGNPFFLSYTENRVNSIDMNDAPLKHHSLSDKNSFIDFQLKTPLSQIENTLKSNLNVDSSNQIEKPVSAFSSNSCTQFTGNSNQDLSDFKKQTKHQILSENCAPRMEPDQKRTPIIVLDEYATQKVNHHKENQDLFQESGTKNGYLDFNSEIKQHKNQQSSNQKPISGSQITRNNLSNNSNNINEDTFNSLSSSIAGVNKTQKEQQKRNLVAAPGSSFGPSQANPNLYRSKNNEINEVKKAPEKQYKSPQQRNQQQSCPKSHQNVNMQTHQQQHYVSNSEYSSVFTVQNPQEPQNYSNSNSIHSYSTTNQRPNSQLGAHYFLISSTSDSVNDNQLSNEVSGVGIPPFVTPAIHSFHSSSAKVLNQGNGIENFPPAQYRHEQRENLTNNRCSEKFSKLTCSSSNDKIQSSVYKYQDKTPEKGPSFDESLKYRSNNSLTELKIVEHQQDLSQSLHQASKDKLNQNYKPNTKELQFWNLSPTEHQTSYFQQPNLIQEGQQMYFQSHFREIDSFDSQNQNNNSSNSNFNYNSNNNQFAFQNQIPQTNIKTVQISLQGNYLTSK